MPEKARKDLEDVRGQLQEAAQGGDADAGELAERVGAYLASDGPSDPVRLSVNASTRFEDVVHVMYTLGKVQLGRYWVETADADGTGFVPVSPPRFGGPSPTAKVFVTEEGFTWRDASGGSGQLPLANPGKALTDPERWPLKALDAKLAVQGVRRSASPAARWPRARCGRGGRQESGAAALARSPGSR